MTKNGMCSCICHFFVVLLQRNGNLRDILIKRLLFVRHALEPEKFHIV